MRAKDPVLGLMVVAAIRLGSRQRSSSRSELASGARRIVNARQWSSAQKRVVLAKDEADEILEHRLVDLRAMKRQSRTLEPVDVHQNHRDLTRLIVDTKQHRRLDCRRHRKHALSYGPLRALHFMRAELDRY